MIMACHDDKPIMVLHLGGYPFFIQLNLLDYDLGDVYLSLVELDLDRVKVPLTSIDDQEILRDDDHLTFVEL